jgi:hypothetical protein
VTMADSARSAPDRPSSAAFESRPPRSRTAFFFVENSIGDLARHAIRHAAGPLWGAYRHRPRHASGAPRPRPVGPAAEGRARPRTGAPSRSGVHAAPAGDAIVHDEEVTTPRLVAHGLLGSSGRDAEPPLYQSARDRTAKKCQMVPPPAATP